MSLQRSPPGGNRMGGSGSGSFTDLRTLQREEEYVTTRQKRKEPESEYKAELRSFRAEMMSFFQEFMTKHSENTTKICQDLNEMINEIKNIKLTNENIMSEQNYIKSELEHIKNQNNSFQNRITTLENDLSNMNKQYQPDTNSLTLSCEDMALELQDRAQRLNNIVVSGISELNNKNSAIRREHDTKEVYSILKTINSECPMPIKVLRLGKYNPNITRSLKVYFETRSPVLNILRNKFKIINKNIRIYPDQTPTQQKYYKDLRAELANRTKNGETNLIIKYIKGSPKIITNTSKN